MKKKRRESPLVRAIKEQTEVSRALLARLTPPKPPEPGPIPEANLPGRCRGCGWKVPPEHEACARCGFMTLRRYPEWLTEAAIEEQKRANPEKKWPVKPQRWDHVTGLQRMLGLHKQGD